MNIVATRSPALVGAGIVAAVFGAMTILSGGRVLFGGEAALAGAGNVVPFVLWFNFIAGFAYVIAGIGMLARRRWSVRLAAAILAATLLVFAAFGIHVATGGTYEMRTVAAMALRSVIWLALTWTAARAIRWR